MRVTLCVDALEPNPGGIGRYTWELGKGLASRDDVAVQHFARNGLIKDPARLLRNEAPRRRRGTAALPVVASDFPLWRQIVEDANCGVVVDPTDSHAVARAIEYVVTHEADARRMGRAGLDAVRERYNWASEETKLIKLYRDLGAESRP